VDDPAPGPDVPAERLLLLGQPGDPPFHRLDEDPLHIRTRDRQHQTGQSGTGSDVSDASREQRRDHGAVQNVPRPEAGRLERADEPAFLAMLSERPRELARAVDAVAEDLGRSGRLGLDLDHGCFT